MNTGETGNHKREGTEANKLASQLSTSAGESLPTADQGARPTRRFRILAIDDRRDALLPLEMLLTRQGHEIRTAPDAGRGLECAVAFLPEVLICDIGLPDLDGYSVARAIRALPALQDSLLIALTGYGREEDHAAALEAGFNFHLKKPLDVDELQRILDAWSQGR